MSAPVSSPDAPPTESQWHEILLEVSNLADAGMPVEALKTLVAALRPDDGRHPRTGPAGPGRVEALARYLETDGSGEAPFLGALVRRVLGETRAVHTLTDAGIPSGHQGFWGELVGRLSRRMLPDVKDPGSLDTILQTVFHHDDDHLWIARTPARSWKRLLSAIGVTAGSVDSVDPDLANAIRILSHHIASLGLQPQITERLPYLEGPDSPFLAISPVTLRYMESFENEEIGDEEPLLDEALAQLERCRQAVETLRAEKDVHGTSLSLTILTYRLQLQIERLDLLLHLTEPVERDFPSCAVRLFHTLVRAVNKRNHLAPHIRESADLLAYQVVEFAASKGSRYITRSPREYFAFFRSSLGGGLLVAIFALFKLLLDAQEVSLAGEAVLFGINYSICFVLIYLTGATLATKQPAMTANTIARSIGGTAKHDIEALKDLVVRTWRSQFVSFAGNLLMAFPAALLLSWGFELWTGQPPASAKKAAYLLEGTHPWLSGALPYAAVAGLFLFASGLVSGYVDNRNRYGQLSSRLARHPLLHRLFGTGRTEKIASFVDKKLGVLAGNVFLGFCLGSAGTIGEILGLPFDIRHIAFSSAHFGMAMETLGWNVPLQLVLEVTLGVMLIGLINFLVSFGLSLALAMESRQVTFRETRALMGGLLRHLARRPLDYFFPPRRSSQARSVR